MVDKGRKDGGYRPKSGDFIPLDGLEHVGESGLASSGIRDADETSRIITAGQQTMGEPKTVVPGQ